VSKVFDEMVLRRKADRPHGALNYHVAKLGAYEQGVKFIAVGETKGATDKLSGLRAQMNRDHVRERDMTRARTKDTERYSAILDQHPPHLAECCWSIRKILESLLAQHQVEACIWKRESGRAAL
jgi:hypothetical protein